MCKVIVLDNIMRLVLAERGPNRIVDPVSSEERKTPTPLHT